MKKEMPKSFDKKRLKVLLVIDGIIFGGGARVFLQLAKGLVNRGHKVFAACVPDGELAPLLKKAGIENLPVNFRSKNILQVVYKIYKHLRTQSIDIVNSQGGRADFCSRIAARILKPKVRIVSTIAMPVEGYDVGALIKGIYCFFDRLLERYVDQFIVVSEALRKYLIINHKIPSEKIIKIYNGVELNEYQPSDSDESITKIRKEYNIEEDIFLIGAVGRMVWQKGFEYLIRGAKEILNNRPKIKILMVGDGPLKDKLQRLTIDLEINNQFIFAGFRKNIKEILFSVDLVVVPSLLEGFPIITLEAMAMAKPIIATRIDGIKEQISDSLTGILMPPKDQSALTKAIMAVINNKELAKTMGLAARAKVEQDFSVEKMVANTERAYLSLL